MFVRGSCGDLCPWRFPGFDQRRPWATSSNFETMPAHKAGGTCTQLFHPKSLSYYLWPIIWARHVSVLMPCQNQTYQEVAEGAKRRGKARALRGGGCAAPDCGVPALDSAQLAWENRSWAGEARAPGSEVRCWLDTGRESISPATWGVPSGQLWGVIPILSPLLLPCNWISAGVVQSAVQPALGCDHPHLSEPRWSGTVAERWWWPSVKHLKILLHS